MMIMKVPDMAKRLELKESAFKKYTLLLEREGYLVDRNRQGHRLFTTEDLEIFEKFIELGRYDGLTLENAAKMVVDSLPPEKRKQEGHDVTTEENEDHNVMTLITTLLSEQEKQLTQKFELQTQQMKEQLDRMEKNQNELLLEIRDRLDQQAKEPEPVAPIVEEVIEKEEAAPEPPKKRFFQFWK